MEYNYLKTLPKDILIKMLTEMDRDRFCEILKDNNLDCCNNKDCYKILCLDTEDYFDWCEQCNKIMCKNCSDMKNCEKCENTNCSECKECKFCNENHGPILRKWEN